MGSSRVLRRGFMQEGYFGHPEFTLFITAARGELRRAPAFGSGGDCCPRRGLMGSLPTGAAPLLCWLAALRRAQAAARPLLRLNAARSRLLHSERAPTTTASPSWAGAPWSAPLLAGPCASLAWLAALCRRSRRAFALRVARWRSCRTRGRIAARWSPRAVLGFERAGADSTSQLYLLLFWRLGGFE